MKNFFPLHLIPNDTKIDFMRWRKPVLILMLVLAVASVGIIVGKGFNYALEFTGGTLVQTSFQKTVDVDQVREKAVQGRLRKRPGAECPRRQ